MFAGSVGMVMSFFYLASSSMGDIIAGAAGFVAGSILVGSGVVSLTLVAVAESRTGEAIELDDE